MCFRPRSTQGNTARRKNLPYREIGKLVVAVDDSELPALADIEKRARANGAPDLDRIDDVARLREIEPHAAGVAAAHSPHTAVVDFAAITEAMAQDVRTASCTILLGQEVPARAVDGAKVSVRTAVSEHVFDRLIVCAGLQSDVVARLNALRVSSSGVFLSHFGLASAAVVDEL
ncbi:MULTISPECIES: FAD-dependent oxidoreductase [unclassified Arthrobacter]|uniref:FAD-dependent oxidoreductase n=1 Tax=unclassified Arthrobacter TaxID=235627 RepID=UPI003394CEBC